MSKIRNRKIWGINLPFLSSSIAPHINYGKGRFGYVSWKNFLADLPTIKIPKNGPRGGIQWVNIKDAILIDKSTYNLLIYYIDANFLFLYFTNTFKELKGEVIIFEEGYFLLEHYEFLKLHNGKQKYYFVRTFKGYDIRFDINGMQGFSIWKNGKNLEDGFWSINETENCILQMSKKSA